MSNMLGKAGATVLLVAGIALAWTTSDAAMIGTSAEPAEAGRTDTVDAGGAGSADTTTNMSFPIQSDGNIVALLHQSNVGEIQAGELARQSAQNSSVRDFAQQMITDHTALDQAGDSLAQSAGIAPELPDSSLVQEQEAQMKTLQSQAGGGFDSTYISQQVVAHEQTIALVDSSVAHASNDALKAALVNSVRPRVAQHLQMAQDLQRSMHSGTR